MPSPNPKNKLASHTSPKVSAPLASSLNPFQKRDTRLKKAIIPLIPSALALKPCLKFVSVALPETPQQRLGACLDTLRTLLDDFAHHTEDLKRKHESPFLGYTVGIQASKSEINPKVWLLHAQFLLALDTSYDLKGIKADFAAFMAQSQARISWRSFANGLDEPEALTAEIIARVGDQLKFCDIDDLQSFEKVRGTSRLFRRQGCFRGRADKTEPHASRPPRPPTPHVPKAQPPKPPLVHSGVPGHPPAPPRVPRPPVLPHQSPATPSPKDWA